MVQTQRSLAMGWLDRTGRATVGLIVGTVVSFLAAELLGTLLAVWWPLPRVWAAWAACALGIAIASWWAGRDRLPWYAWHGRPRHRRQHSVRHGWVDLVFRGAIGICAGVASAWLIAAALLVWLEALQIDLDAGSEMPGLTAFAILGLGTWVGALLGFFWFAADLPWLPGRRRRGAPTSPP